MSLTVGTPFDPLKGKGVCLGFTHLLIYLGRTIYISIWFVLLSVSFTPFYNSYLLQFVSQKPTIRVVDSNKKGQSLKSFMCESVLKFSVDFVCFYSLTFPSSVVIYVPFP